MKQLGVRQITKRGSGVEGLSVFLHLFNIHQSGSSGCPAWVCVCLCMCMCKYARLPRVVKVEFAAFDCVLPDITPDRCSFSGRMFGKESVHGYSAVRLSITRTQNLRVSLELQKSPNQMERQMPGKQRGAAPFLCHLSVLALLECQPPPALPRPIHSLFTPDTVGSHFLVPAPGIFLDLFLSELIITIISNV